MVDHFSDLTYLHLMIITIQEETLAGKSDLEIWSATFGFKIHRYHTDNGRFYEQLFRSEIEDSYQIITFCGVVYHHQNAIVKRKIKLLYYELKHCFYMQKYIGQRQYLQCYGPIQCRTLQKNNELNLDDYGIHPMGYFAGTTIDITLKHHHPWGFPVYVSDAILQCNISGILMW